MEVDRDTDSGGRQPGGGGIQTVEVDRDTDSGGRQGYRQWR